MTKNERKIQTNEIESDEKNVFRYNVFRAIFT